MSSAKLKTLKPTGNGCGECRAMISETMSKSSVCTQEIILYNRCRRAVEKEQVPGEKLLRLIYGRPWGRKTAHWIWSQILFSRFYGWPLHQRFSRKQIDPFISQHKIDMSEVEVPDQGFQSFNDFFIRRLKPGARPIPAAPKALVSPADSRLKVFPLHQGTLLDIKGHTLTLPHLLGTDGVADLFANGLCLQFRLAPRDYHRFGHIEDGLQGPIHIVGGRLFSVSPIALRHMPAIWGNNYRHWCFVQTHCLGTILQVEVGATMVGSIIQHQPQGGRCRRGQEKGYFQMGGSTVLIVLPPGRVHIDDDIMNYAEQGIETIVRYGESIGRHL
jgi:phosphatidylserine decarboxylase